MAEKKFLDSAGLSTVWEKIKNNFATKSEIITPKNGKLLLELNDSGNSDEIFSANTENDSTFSISGGETRYSESGDAETPGGTKYISRGSIKFDGSPVWVEGSERAVYNDAEIIENGNHILIGNNNSGSVEYAENSYGFTRERPAASFTCNGTTGLSYVETTAGSTYSITVDSVTTSYTSTLGGTLFVIQTAAPDSDETGVIDATKNIRVCDEISQTNHVYSPVGGTGDIHYVSQVASGNKYVIVEVNNAISVNYLYAIIRFWTITSGEYSSVGIGSGVKNTGRSAISIGTSSESSGTNSISIGKSASAKGMGNVSIGLKSETNGLHSVALGDSTTVNGSSSVVVGTSSTLNGNHSVVIGDTTTSNGSYTVAVGFGSKTTGAQGTAVGNRASASENSFAGGRQSVASGKNSIAVGYGATASGVGGVSIGTSGKNTATRSVNIGNTSEVNSERGIAIGYGAKVNSGATSSIVIGDSQVSSTTNQILIGNFNSANRSDKMAVGQGGNTWFSIDTSARFKAENSVIEGTTSITASTTEYTYPSLTKGNVVVSGEGGKVALSTTSATLTEGLTISIIAKDNLSDVMGSSLAAGQYRTYKYVDSAWYVIGGGSTSEAIYEIGDELGSNKTENLAILKQYIQDKRELNFKGKTFDIEFDGLIDVDYPLVIRNGHMIISCQNSSTTGGFNIESGFSLYMKDMEISNGTSANVHFLRSESINYTIDHIVIDNCRFDNLSRVMRIISAEDAWQSDNMGINVFKVTDSIFNWETVSGMNGLKIADIPVKKMCLFQGNTMINCCVGLTIAIENSDTGNKVETISNRCCPYIVKGNYFDCGVYYRTSGDNGTYHSSVVLECGKLYFEDNIIERCVTISELADESTAYDMYCNAYEVYGNNNVIKNIMGWATGSGTKPLTEVFKSKMAPVMDGTVKVVRKFTNNTIHIDSDYLETLGLDLSSETMNSLCFMTMNEGYSFTEINLENNVFDMPKTFAGHAYRSAKRFVMDGNKIAVLGNTSTYGIIDISSSGTDYVCETLQIVNNHITVKSNPMYVLTVGCKVNDFIMTDNILEGVKGSLFRVITRSSHKILRNFLVTRNKLSRSVGTAINSNDIISECTGAVRYSRQIHYENASTSAPYSIKPQNEDYKVNFFMLAKNSISEITRFIRMTFANTDETEYRIITSFTSEKHQGLVNTHVLRIKALGSTIKYYSYDSDSWVNLAAGTKIYIDNIGTGGTKLYISRANDLIAFTQEAGSTNLVNNTLFNVSVEVVEVSGSTPVTEPSLLDSNGDMLYDSNGDALMI